MILVAIESPYSGARWDVPEEHPEARNLRYLRACLADSLSRGEAPFASHALYTQPGVLDDATPEERAKGIQAGFRWAALARVRVFYTDLGWSEGMRLGQDEAIRIGQAIEYRTLRRWET